MHSTQNLILDKTVVNRKLTSFPYSNMAAKPEVGVNFVTGSWLLRNTDPQLQENLTVLALSFMVQRGDHFPWRDPGITGIRRLETWCICIFQTRWILKNAKDLTWVFAYDLSHFHQYNNGRPLLIPVATYTPKIVTASLVFHRKNT